MEYIYIPKSCNLLPMMDSLFLFDTEAGTHSIQLLRYFSRRISKPKKKTKRVVDIEVNTFAWNCAAVHNLYFDYSNQTIWKT